MKSEIVDRSKLFEALLWSIALPGFSQLLNKSYVKGIALLILEFVINVQSNLNMAIILSFKGNISEAIEHVNYQWLLFYPCVYLFAIWDAFREAGGDSPYSYLPFVFAAFMGTIGVIYSPNISVSGVRLGPIWLPIIFLIIGSLMGALLKRYTIK